MYEIYRVVKRVIGSVVEDFKPEKVFDYAQTDKCVIDYIFYIL